MPLHARRILLAVSLLAVGCSPELEPGVETDSPAAGTTGADDHAATDSMAAAGEDHSAHEGAGEPMALLPIMRQLAIDMAAMQNALWLEDFDEVEERAGAIAEHPHMTEEEIARIQTELGAEMQAFEEADERVHHASVEMHEAAAARDTSAVLERLAEVQAGCVDCHARFRERLRTTQQ